MLEVTGPEAAAYLDAHLTCRVAEDAHGALLAPKGTLLGLVRLERAAEGFRVFSEQAAVRQALERGRVGWMVELTPFEHHEPPMSDLERVERGIPALGRDIDERTLPAEAGLVGTLVRTDKGMYPGMQTVLRQQRSGTVHRALRRLALDAPVPEGAEVHDEAGVLGTIGTAVVHPTRGPLALALLRSRAVPGTRVRIAEVSGIVEP
ncbi:hypothetical protein DVA67_005660 [Solirubrobacter sp. CPCC 204708]|uniref:Aminomethyltransferase folate-binding domain-containing protein n=1 Tax=Solirubrobacter deserti TaxID=2282478 RepID=A0ABT4RGN9_9ACTN|nr:hypothetical protein [Solirubrobacter deserti]MBE2315451.1 hypothetical protein [Solirubrobacter deserti]MDA0137707.1 hypothetical protein [Solirubrobacter deserti]